MIYHPLSLSLLSLDLLSLYFLISALFAASRMVLYWSPGAATAEQILLESAAETASLQGRIVLILQLFSFLLLLFAIASVFPGLVPGAMCGTGVLQAGGEVGVRTLLVRVGVLLCLSVWYQIDCSNRALPEGELSLSVAKALLCSAPFVFMSVALTVTMLWQLNVEQVVDCCAVVYGEFASVSEANAALGVENRFWLQGLLLLSFLLLAAGVVIFLHLPTVKKAVLFATIACLWCVAATITLIHVFSSYHYGVLHHNCPWCLFLPEHYSVGYLLFPAIALVLVESISIIVNSRVATLEYGLESRAEKRIRKSTCLIFGAMIIYFLLAVLPAILWKVRHGVWIG